MTRLLLAPLLALAVMAGAIAAGKGQPGGLVLSDQGITGPVRTDADGVLCLGEDSGWKRYWDGDMYAGQKHTAYINRCGGGLSILAQADIWRGTVELRVVSPSGVVFTGHDLGAIDRKQRIARCNVAPRVSGGVGGSVMESGVWRIEFTALTDVRRTRLTVQAFMFWPESQVSLCPAADWDSRNWPSWPYT